MIQYSLESEIDPKQIIHALAYSLDGQFLAVAVPDGIKIYLSDTGRLFLRIYTLSPALCLCWDPKGNLLCGCQSGYLAVISINLRSKNTRAIFSHVSQRAVDHIAVHGAGDYLALAENGSISIWKYRGWFSKSRSSLFPWIFQKEFEKPCPDGTDDNVTVTSMAWVDPKRLFLVVAYSAQGIRVWDIYGQEPISSVPTRVAQGVLSPCGRYFANSLQNGVKIVEMETSVDLKFLDHGETLSCAMPVIWLHGGGYLLCAKQGQADLWHVETKQRRSLVLNEGQTRDPITHLTAFMGQCNNMMSFQIVLVCNHKYITIWKAEQKMPTSNVPLIYLAVPAVVVSLFIVNWLYRI